MSEAGMSVGEGRTETLDRPLRGPMPSLAIALARPRNAFLVAFAILAVWAVLPSLMLPRSAEHLRAIVMAQLGEPALAYLSYAPPRLCRYVLLAPGIAPVPLFLVSWSLLQGARSSAADVRQTVERVALSLVVSVSLYCCGELVVAFADSRDSPPRIVASFALWLGLFGVASAFPLWGWATCCALGLRRFRWALGAFVLGWLLLSVANQAGQALQSTWPLPAQLKLQLLSGRVEQQPAAFAWLLAWGVAPVLVAVFAPRASRSREPANPR